LSRRLTHVIGFDDAPFPEAHRGDVLIVGAVYAGERLSGVVTGKVRRDGANATRVLAALVRGSRFYSQLHVMCLQGIALAGFNADFHRAKSLNVLLWDYPGFARKFGKFATETLIGLFCQAWFWPSVI
jgi:uncharacterized protein